MTAVLSGDCLAAMSRAARGKLEAKHREKTRAHTRLAVTCLTHPDAMPGLEIAWREMETRGQRAVLFQSYDWCRLVWRTQIAARTGAAFEGRVLVIGDPARPDAIWPLQIRTSTLGRFATDLTDPFGQYSDLLLAPAADLKSIMTAALTELRRWRIDGVLLRKVRADAAIHPWMHAHATVVGDRQAAPVVELSGFTNFEGYHRSLDAKTRKNLRNYRNRVQREGRLDHCVATCEPDLAGIVHDCFEQRTSWLEAGGLSSTAFADPAFPALVQGICSPERGQLDLRAMRLTLERPDGERSDLSLHWGIVHNGVYTAYMAAKNPQFDTFSPGRLHLEDLLRASADAGVTTVDFLAPEMPYKLSFTKRSIAIESLALPLTLRGKIAIIGWHGKVRAALKALSVRLPASLRRRVLRMAGVGPRQT